MKQVEYLINSNCSSATMINIKPMKNAGAYEGAYGRVYPITKIKKWIPKPKHYIEKQEKTPLEIFHDKAQNETYVNAGIVVVVVIFFTWFVIWAWNKSL